MLYYQNLIGQKDTHSLKSTKQYINKNRELMDLIDLNNSNTIRLKRFLKNLEELLTNIDSIRVRLIEFITQTINILNRDRLLNRKHIYSTYVLNNQSLRE